MSESTRLRARATRLLALAIKARENGESDYADRLVEESAKLFDRAEALERAVMSTPEASQPQAAQQQQQQPQPNDPGKEK